MLKIVYYVYMLTETQINKLLEYRGRAEIYNQMLRGLVEFSTRILGDEDLAHNFIYEVWDLDKLMEEENAITR